MESVNSLEANERLRRNHDFAARIIFCKSDGILPTQKDVLIMFGQIQLKKERYGLILELKTDQYCT